MWKQFTYSDKVRVAWVPSEGSCYQVICEDKINSGFRQFDRERMLGVQPAANHFHLIENDDLEYYGELREAKEPKFELTLEEVCQILEGCPGTHLCTRMEAFADKYHVEVPCSN